MDAKQEFKELVRQVVREEVAGMPVPQQDVPQQMPDRSRMPGQYQPFADGFDSNRGTLEVRVATPVMGGVAYANVRLREINVAGTTNFAGWIKFTSIPLGTYHVEAIDHRKGRKGIALVTVFQWKETRADILI